MTQAHLNLEIFEVGPLDDQESLISAFQAEKMRETAYEQGYAAGWQDALENMRSEDELRSIAAQEALQAIGFSYNEAHQALSGSFLALAQTILQTVLPEAARLALPAFLATELDALLARHTRPDVQILCAPGVHDTLGAVVASCTQTKIELISEPSFSEAQLVLRLGSEERMVDLDDLLNQMREIFALHQNRRTEQETAYGRA